MINQYIFGGELTSVPTFILIGDSNIDGRGYIASPSLTKYFSEYATDIIHADKTTVKIFDNRGGSDLWVTLNTMTCQINGSITVPGNFGYEQTLMWELAQYYGAQEIRILKRGVSSGMAGVYSTWPSYTPGQTEALAFEEDLENAIAAAEAEGVYLDFKAVITGLGTNDAAATEAVANAYEAAMTAIIEHLRDDIFGFDIPFILTGPTKQSGVVLYPDIIIAAQEDIAAALTDVYICPVYGYSTTSHTKNAGIFGVGLAIADSVLVNVLGQSTISEKYIFSFETNRSGAYSIQFAVNEDFYDYYVDWGDGNQDLVTADYTVMNHTYSDSSTKTIKIMVNVPWNIFSLYISTAAGNSNIVGELDLSRLTGLDGFVTSGANTLMTSLVDPIDNYAYLSAIPPNLFVNCGLTAIDLTRYFIASGTGINITTNTSLLSIVDKPVGTKNWPAGVNITGNTNLISIDFGDINGQVTGIHYIYNNAKLEEFITRQNNLGNILAYGIFSQNTILTEIDNYQDAIYAAYIEMYNCDLNRTNLDNIINEMWDRCQDTAAYRNAANKRLLASGNNGLTGTYDGSTDWSAGLPTSPAAKAYDLVNDVTGTYNFTTITF
jgi:hypothetical protein